ncbi:MAG: methylenetetrahydrofolate reductase C-terminal domain-containing protein [Chloroflexi bacterium]|nr:methylenetetrahydrofolate reductase C-terminal domain-containing protein [Chloroflexota bacterium]MBI2980538.1 methylenetetrahydrofolate reductase C-terminal domain-containing protein [Chloroflexota bacterium]
MITITKPKPFEEIKQYLKRSKGVYLVGCGTCATMLHTGGKSEVLSMKDKLEAEGKKVTGWMVIPTGCDPLAGKALETKADDINAADSILVMSCSFEVQTVRLYSPNKSVYPALDTMFIGKEERPGYFAEVCLQCGSCILGRTAAICPLVRCAKLLFNGPCGGSVGGKCEVDPGTPCGWQQIIDRLTTLGQLDQLEEIEPVKDWSTSVSGGPRQITFEL